MAWKEINEQTIYPISILGIRDSMHEWSVPSQDIVIKKENLPKANLDAWASGMIIISPYVWTYCESETDLLYQNPRAHPSSQTGKIVKLGAAIRNRTYLDNLGMWIQFPTCSKLDYRTCFYGGFKYILEPSDIEKQANLTLKDTRGLVSSLRDTIASEIESEIRRLGDLCPGVSFDINRCLEFMRKTS